MEALGMAAGAKAVSCFENSLLVRKSASVALSSSASATSTSAADCCVAFRASAKKDKKVCSVAAPLGLSGDGLSGGVRRSGNSGFSPASSSSCSSSSRPKFSRRESRLTSPPLSAAAAAAPVRSLEGESSLMKDIDSQDLEAETPLLLQQCSDLDWKKLGNDLRSEALHGLHSSGSRALSLKALEKLMASWIHEQMVDGLERPGAAGEVLAAEEPGWSLEAATSELRMEANLQAAQMLATGVDITFDWETDVDELHQRILLATGAKPSALRPEQRLWKAWARAQRQMLETSDKLYEEAVASTSVDEQFEALDSKQPAETETETVESSSESIDSKSTKGKSLLSLGAAMATSLALESIWLLDAVADEGSPDVIEAVSRAPSWLVPAVLVFPPLSYLLFNVYRDKVNPYAKVTDWMFGVVALTIVSNIVMMAVWGVRLY